MLQKELTESEKKRGRKKEGKRKEMIKGEGQEGKTERKCLRQLKDNLQTFCYTLNTLGICLVFPQGVS